MTLSSTVTAVNKPAQLLVWTDIASEHEDDFNEWYDREHMQERIAIPGFTLARRFHAPTGPRRYLALYRTENLDVFRSEAYRRIFSNQTAWSNRVFERMVDTVRCVGRIESQYGEGEGRSLSLVKVPALGLETPAVGDSLDAQLREAVKRPGIVAGAVMRSEPSLSGPLTGGGAAQTASIGVIWLEGSSTHALVREMREIARTVDCEPSDVATFDLLWALRRSPDAGDDR
ncbi:hypothetical protein [Burkholderia multivorans]|uniref:hypothetical protein n=1 Tax=Burkholderia multivorans TaxID=87883 RepID=UPI0032C085A7